MPSTYRKESTMNLERVKNIPNGEKVVPTFSAAEMERQLLPYLTSPNESN